MTCEKTSDRKSSRCSGRGSRSATARVKIQVETIIATTRTLNRAWRTLGTVNPNRVFGKNDKNNVWRKKCIPTFTGYNWTRGPIYGVWSFCRFLIPTVPDYNYYDYNCIAHELHRQVEQI